MIVRPAVVGVACVIAVTLLAAREQARSCSAAEDLLFARASVPGKPLEESIETLEAACSGSEPLTRAAAGLGYFGRDEQVLRVAREAVRREPANYRAWAMRWQAARAGEAREALQRAHDLNPLGPLGPPR
jgi:hypothetical protein